jgi:soluble lytic murein transglycosylase-like protein
MEKEDGWHHRTALSVMKLSAPLLAVLLTTGCETVSRSAEPPLHEMIRAAAVSHDISPEIALGLIDVESTFKHTAAKDGNYGLMQIRVATAKAMGFKGNLNELMTPENNVEYGLRYLQYCQDKYHDVTLALGCYNGSTSIKNHYAKRVIKASKKY